MKYQNVFKRYELKYMLDENQYESIKNILNQYMESDKYATSTIHNIYFYTQLIRISFSVLQTLHYHY